MKTKFGSIFLAGALITSAYAAGDAEKKSDTAESTGGANKANAPNGKSVLVLERSTPKIVGIVPPGWKVVPLESAKIKSDPIETPPSKNRASIRPLEIARPIRWERFCRITPTKSRNSTTNLAQ